MCCLNELELKSNFQFDFKTRSGNVRKGIEIKYYRKYNISSRFLKHKIRYSTC